MMLSHNKSQVIPGVWNNTTEKLFSDGVGRKDGFEVIVMEYLEAYNFDNNSLRNEILKYQDANIETAKSLSAFGIQCICDKITLLKTSLFGPAKWQVVELRSATIPVTWDSRMDLMSVFGLLATLQYEYDLQKDTLKKLRRENNFLDPVDEKESVRYQSGNGISPRPYLDRDLYNRHMENHEVEEYPLPPTLCKHLDAAIDSDNLIQFKKEMRKVLALISLNEERKQNEGEYLEFLEEFLTQVYKAYEAPIDHDSDEDAFNQLFTWPYLHLIGKSINSHDCKGYFVQGQPFLESMSHQLKATGVSVNEKSQYKTDGMIKLFGLKNLELLSLETSGHFSNSDNVKIKLDHHKGIYGILAMLKCIADKYSFASVEKFSRVKVFFLHAAETKLHLWSLHYQPDGFFDLWRESCLQIQPHFEDRMVFLPQLIKFCWNTKCLLEQAVNNIAECKNEHQEISSKYRYNPEMTTHLGSIINPVILKLTKEEDCVGEYFKYGFFLAVSSSHGIITN
ncbi:hypothetical protein G6F57_006685 [Rhizopus arrhizus]|uniref:Uncharacterized protein n=1 Tax=Rhizopus oryzae TaxID=64495 RepID=A0A9P6X8Z0_RHIOR|nr:hypothetical protein G6F30_007734 [Rhizopus arrhizus]KAG1421192.1 hypothetical protein G6F58_003852 [Rhizopus delemar]KAG0983899.1 hypothetical protein G6F29_005175 [Rhizopus arrhizus]KAG0995736.1 hypothetical protein G6F28_004509 [Rhizopus arrhizus]KAG1009600.1 hypothetical protein G6F27_005430 [Rhizopus arrhizus]